VIRVSNEYNRGGLKVFVDHGHGVATSANHLGRALVGVGEPVRRGQPIALSGYSGLDGLLFSTFVAPHVHFNVFLDGRHVDPFAEVGSDEPSLWLGGGPRHPREAGPDAPRFEPSTWDPEAVRRTLESCRDAALRAELAALDLDAAASALLFLVSYYPTRFDDRPRLYAEAHPRRPLLSLPFEAYEGVFLPA